MINLMYLSELDILMKKFFLFMFLGFSGFAPTHAADVVHLHLLGATDNHSPVLVVLEMDGHEIHAAAVAEPYQAGHHAGRVSLRGNLQVDAVSPDTLSRDGTRLHGTLQQKDAFSIELNLQQDGHTLKGAYAWRDSRGERVRETSGEAVGMLLPLPDPREADLLTLYFHNPLPGRAEGGRHGSAERAIASIRIREGRPASITLVDSLVHAASRNNRQSIPVAMAGGWTGWQAVDDETRFQSVSVSGAPFDESMVISATVGDTPLAYHLKLQRVGDLVFGTYRLEGGGDGHENEVSGYLGKQDHLPYPVTDEADPLQTHLRWLTRTNAYGGGLYGNDMGLSTVRNTGSKDYNDPPIVGAFGPFAARAVLQTHDDPILRAQTLMMAQRSGHYILSHRTGPLNLLPTYKTMFRPQYWMGRALVDLAVITESDFWKARALEVADALRRTQGPEGSWSYVDAGSGETGTTLSRHDRTWDHVPRANGMWLDLLGRIRTELNVEDYRDVEDRAAAWMRTALLEGATHQGRRYLIEGRNHNSRPDDDGPTFYALYQLKYADAWDDALFKATLEWAELLWHDGDDRLPRIGYEQQRGPPGLTTVGTMRMALIYLLAAEKTGDTAHLQKAGQLYNSVMQMYRPGPGIFWDSPVWDRPQVQSWSYHAYAVLPAEVALNLIEFREAADRLAQQGIAVPQPQTITFPDMADLPGRPAQISLPATADSGLPVRYEVDNGPATVADDLLTLSGETGIVWITAYQDGSDAYIPALSVQRNFAVGRAAPPPPGDVETWSVNNRSVRVSWSPSAGENVIHYTVEHSRDQGETWQQAAQVDAETLAHEVSGLERGETRLFRVLAHNPSFASDPSKAVAGTAHAEDFHREIDLRFVQRGQHWDRRPYDNDPEKIMLVPTQSSRSSDPNDDISFWFTIDIGEQTGRYEVHYYCWGNAGSNDSAWLRSHTDESFNWISIGNQEWTWRRRGLDLNEPGQHTIYFGARQHGNDGPRIQRVIITNTANR